jgi:hypothetical protein
MAAYEAAGESDEWYTPKYIFDALGLRFDLDVAAPVGGGRAMCPVRRGWTRRWTDLCTPGMGLFG